MRRRAKQCRERRGLEVSPKKERKKGKTVATHFAHRSRFVVSQARDFIAHGGHGRLSYLDEFLNADRHPIRKFVFRANLRDSIAIGTLIVRRGLERWCSERICLVINFPRLSSLIGPSRFQLCREKPSVGKFHFCASDVVTPCARSPRRSLGIPLSRVRWTHEITANLAG